MTRAARQLARVLAVVTALAALAATAAVPAGAAEGAVWLPTRAGGTGFPSFGLASDDARDQLVAFASTSYAARTMTFDGQAWTTRATAAQAPSPRLEVAMAYDAARRVTVLFGGHNTVDFDETWTWDGSSWSRHTPTVRPPARRGAAMAYDAARQVMLLFGGYTAATGTYLNDLWEWDGATWAEVGQGSRRPAPRAYAAMAWSGQLVLFGGSDGRAFNDCWGFSAGVWFVRCNHVPFIPSRQDATMATDAYSGTLVLWGGHDHDGRQFTDTWLGTQRRNSDWVNFEPANALAPPPYARGARLAYLARHGRMVLVTSSATWFFDTLLSD